MSIQKLLLAHPKPPALGQMGVTELAAAIEASFACAAACTLCADACLSEPEQEKLLRCIRLDLDCADLCAVTGRVLSRPTGESPALIRLQLEACIAICRECAEECEKHAPMHEHCRLCAEACRHCENECRFLLQRLPATAVPA